MKSLILLALSSLPSTLSLAIHARQANATTPTPTLPILPPPNEYTQADVAYNCARWDIISPEGMYHCTDVMAMYPGVSFSELTLWNPSVGPSCDNMWDNYWFCSAISGPFVPLPTPTPAGFHIPPPGTPQSGQTVSKTCDRWDRIASGASCQTFMSRYPGLTLIDLQTWNPNMVTEIIPCFLSATFDLCTSIVGHVFTVPPASTPTLPTSPAAPGPTQVGVTSACVKWDTVQDGDSCSGFISEYGVTLEQLVQWNPAVGEMCTNLWGGYAVCVGV